MQRNPEIDWVTAESLAELSDESYNTIDYWSERGLLELKRRGRKRFYSSNENLRRIKLIRDLQNKNYSISAILDKIHQPN